MNTSICLLVPAMMAALCALVHAADLPAEVTKELDSYIKTKEGTHLERAYSEAKSTAKDSREATEKRLKFFALVASDYDPNYDLSPPPPPPTWSVESPPGYDSGISPKAVKDPAERAAYEKRIAENQKLANIHATQRTLRKVVEDLAYHVARLSPADKEALDPMIKNLNLAKPVQSAFDKEVSKQKENGKKK